MLTEDQLSDFLLLENWVGLTCFTRLVTRNQEEERSLRESLELLELTEAERSALRGELSIRDAKERQDLIETMTVTISDQGRLDPAIIKFLKAEPPIVSQSLFQTQTDSMWATVISDPPKCYSLIEALAPQIDAEKLNEGGFTENERGPFEADPTPFALSFYDRYHISGELGRGGMALVHQLRDTRIGRDVALKSLKSNTNELARQSFLIETRVMGQLEHPGILPVYDMLTRSELDQISDLSGGSNTSYTMRIARHKSLADLIEEGDLDPYDLCAWLKQVALTLEHAHQRGVIHRDIKPHNILLGGEGEVYLTDWGVCLLDVTHPDAHLMSSDLRYALVGSPPFMSPEQALCQPKLMGPTADVYSLGATLYHGLTGRLPIQGTSLSDFLWSLRHEEISPVNHVRSERGLPLIASELAEICMRALEKTPNKRYQSARAFADALDRFLRGELERERQIQRAEDALRRAHLEAARFDQLFKRQSELRDEITSLRTQYKQSNDPEVRALLWRQEELLDTLLSPLEESFSHAISSYRTTLSYIKDHAEAKRELSRLFLTRYEEAETLGDRAWVTYFEERLREYGDEAILSELDGACQINLERLPLGVEVSLCSFTAQRYRTISQELMRLVSPIHRPIELGRGDYLLKLKHPQSAEVRIPLSLRRVNTTTLAPRLPRAASMPQGFTFIEDNLAMQTHPVTVAAYFDFLNDLKPEVAAQHAPRYYHTAYALPNQEGVYSAPFLDVEGDEWLPDWPVMLVSLTDASAYATWLGERLKRVVRLPTASEWLKAAQGSDQRPYPWGLAFDSSLCSMRESRSGRPTPTVVGAYESDRSPYGIYDVSGTIAQWTSSVIEGDTQYYRVMGAAFNSMELLCDLNQEIRALGDNGMIHIGFRLVCELTEDDFLDPPY